MSATSRNSPADLKQIGAIVEAPVCDLLAMTVSQCRDLQIQAVALVNRPAKQARSLTRYRPATAMSDNVRTVSGGALLEEWERTVPERMRG